MPTALKKTDSGPADGPACPVRGKRHIEWWQDLPAQLRECVVAPVSFDVLHEYEMPADRTFGRDAVNQPCFCAFRYVLTQLRSDDDEVFYEAPVYAQTLTAWRLRDTRWLTLRKTVMDADLGEIRTSLSLSDAMPR